MREHAAAGHVVVVISATFEPIILRAREHHPFENQVSTRMRVAPDGTYTREVEGLPVEGEQKLVALTDFADARFGAGNWELAYAYGDHHSDRALLSAATHAFAVDPDKPLARTARKRGWRSVLGMRRLAPRGLPGRLRRGAFSTEWTGRLRPVNARLRYLMFLRAAL